MRQQIVGSSVDGLGSHDVLAGFCQGLERIIDRRRSGRHGQRRHTALQGSDPLFEDVLGRIRQPSIDIARVPKTEPVCRVLGIMEHIGCTGVDGHRSRVGHRVRLLLSDM